MRRVRTLRLPKEQKKQAITEKLLKKIEREKCQR